MIMRLLLLVLLFGALNLHAGCQSKYFSFKVKSTKRAPGTIMNVLENLSKTCKLNLILADQKSREIVSKPVSYMNIQDVSLDELLDLLLGENNLNYEMVNDRTLKISYLKTKSFYIDYVNFTKRSSSSSKKISTGNGDEGNGDLSISSQSDFRFWDNLQKEVQNILHRDGDQYTPGEVTINQEAGLLTVTGTKKQLDRVSKYIATMMNRLHKQILIDAKIIEVTYDAGQTAGIDWSKFQANLESHGGSSTSKGIHPLVNANYLVGYNFTMEGLLNFLKTQGKVNVVSNPRILTLNNQPAIINVGEEKNYKFTTGTQTTTTNGTVLSEPQFEVGSTFVGVTLSILPEVSQDNYIILKINPVVSEITERHLDKNGVPSLAPDIKIKQLSSIVKVKNNKKILLGGLIQQRTEDQVNKIPLLGDIPILGHIFRSKKKVKSKSELIIVMTPKLVRGDEGEPSLEKLENGIDYN
jgi:general secretion pathway protein D